MNCEKDFSVADAAFWTFECSDHGIAKVGKDLQDNQSQHQLNPPMPIVHVPQCHIPTFLEHLQGLHPLPGLCQCLTTLCEEVFPNIQREPPLVQSEAIT